jgi:hypothetical protein
LTARLEWFVARFGGLRYDVRRRVRIGDRTHESVRRWEFDLLPTRARPSPRPYLRQCRKPEAD